MTMELLTEKLNLVAVSYLQFVAEETVFMKCEIEA